MTSSAGNRPVPFTGASWGPPGDPRTPGAPGSPHHPLLLLQLVVQQLLRVFGLSFAVSLSPVAIAGAGITIAASAAASAAAAAVPAAAVAAGIA